MSFRDSVLKLSAVEEDTGKDNKTEFEEFSLQVPAVEEDTAKLYIQVSFRDSISNFLLKREETGKVYKGELEQFRLQVPTGGPWPGERIRSSGNKKACCVSAW